VLLHICIFIQRVCVLTWLPQLRFKSLLYLDAILLRSGRSRHKLVVSYKPTFRGRPLLIVPFVAPPLVLLLQLTDGSTVGALARTRRWKNFIIA